MAVFLAVPCGARAQTPADEEAAVRAALQHYLDGHATGRGAEFEKVFAAEARLFWIQDGRLMTRTSAEYIAGAPGRPADDEQRRRRRIAMVDIAGNAAIARIELDYPGAHIVDYMSLLKIDGTWRIVNKIFHADRAAPLDSLRRVFETAVANNDAEAQARLYASDAILQPSNRPARIGRDAIREGYRRFLDEVPDATIDYEPLAAGQAGDHAWEAGSALETGTGAGGTFHADSGKYLWVWKRVDGEWRIAVHSFSLDALPVAPPSAGREVPRP